MRSPDPGRGLRHTHRFAITASHRAIVRQIRERLTVIPLSEAEYVFALERASSQSIVGAAAYDALIAHCALQAGAVVLLTLNVRDFARFGPPVAQLVKTPAEL